MKHINIWIKSSLCALFVLLALGILFPQAVSQAKSDTAKATRTPSKTPTPTRTVTNTPTITSTPTITPTPTDRPGVHTAMEKPDYEIKLDQEILGPVAYSNDGHVAVGFNGGVYIYDTRDYSLKKFIKLSYQVDHLAYSPNGKFLAAASHYTGKSDNIPYTVNIWETYNWHLESAVTDGRGVISAIAWDMESRIVVVGRDTVDKNKSALFLFYTNGAAVASFESPTISSLMVSSDNRELIAGAKDGYVYVYDFMTGKVKNRIKARASAVTGLGYYKPDWISASDAGGYVYVWNDESQPIYNGDLAAQSGFSMSPDRRAVAFCSRYGVLINFDFTAEDSYYQTADSRCARTAFSKDGSQLVASFNDGYLRFFSVYSEGRWQATSIPSLSPTATMKFPALTPNPVSTAESSAIRPSNANKLAFVSTPIKMDDFVVSHKDQMPLPYEINGVSGATWLAYNADGTVKAYPDKTSVVVDNSATGVIISLQANNVKINTIVFSPTGNLIAAGAIDGTVTIWDYGIQRTKCEIFTTPVFVKALQFNHAGSMLAVGYDNQTIEIFDVDSCSKIAEMPKNTRLINDLAFSPDDVFLSSAAADSLALIFYLPTQNQVKKFEPDHNVKGIYSVAINPSQTILAVGTYEGYVTMWNMNSGEYLTRVKVSDKSNPVVNILFSRDAAKIFACLKDKTCVELGLNK